MRTNIEIDDELMKTAMKLSGLKTKKMVVHKALKVLINRQKRARILKLRGHAVWDGNLDEMRKIK